LGLVLGVSYTNVYSYLGSYGVRYG
jgi:hypothetical protein